jgi:hypothetical protein
VLVSGVPVCVSSECAAACFRMCFMHSRRGLRVLCFSPCLVLLRVSLCVVFGCVLWFVMCFACFAYPGRLYSIIYKAIEEIKAAMEGMLAPEFEEKWCTSKYATCSRFRKSERLQVVMCLTGKVTRNTKLCIP